MVVLLTHVLCPRKKHVSHLTSAARLACSIILCGIPCVSNEYGDVRSTLYRVEKLELAAVEGRNGAST
jgi:hypothetical protein